MFARRSFNLINKLSTFLKSISKRDYSPKTPQLEYFEDFFEPDCEMDPAEVTLAQKIIDEELLSSLYCRLRLAKLIELDPYSFPDIIQGETIADYIERQYRGILPQINRDFNYNVFSTHRLHTIDDIAVAKDLSF
ncbi:unnamed protein product [Moneuplotes crassus]|uniref:Uncharacterized protein n=1 Tax=Euplotes crassus TaxID=5936 RepID=A0AAD1UL57_EUPCR|nr:unnamed protein product [Moneuplotes crassus]